VNLPKNTTLIRKLSVQADLFSLAASDLQAFLINQVDIVATVAPIRIDQLVGESITIRTNNGLIEGSFKISKALNLATTNGAIVANVALALSTQDSQSSILQSDTRPGMQSLVFNDSPSSNKNNPSVSVDVATINGAVTVKYVDHPPNLKLFSYVKSTNGRAHVEHAPAYEGEFEVETTWGSAEVKGPSSKQDPTDQARERHKLIKSNRDELGFRRISGLVWWGQNDEDTRARKSELGHTLVKTTLGSALAIFQ